MERDRQRRYDHDGFNLAHVATADAICQPMRSTTTRQRLLGMSQQKTEKEHHSCLQRNDERSRRRPNDGPPRHIF